MTTLAFNEFIEGMINIFFFFFFELEFFWGQSFMLVLVVNG